MMTAKGVPLNVVQALLRHKDVRSTLRYAHVQTCHRQAMVRPDYETRVGVKVLSQCNFF